LNQTNNNNNNNNNDFFNLNSQHHHDNNIQRGIELEKTVIDYYSSTVNSTPEYLGINNLNGSNFKVNEQTTWLGGLADAVSGE